MSLERFAGDEKWAESLVWLDETKDFDPSQPRDEEGKWTDTGAAAKGKTEWSDFSKADISLDNATTIDTEKKQKFIETWNDRINVAPEEFKKSFLGGLKGNMRMEYNDGTEEIEIKGVLLDDDGKHIATYERMIDLDDNTAASSYFKITGETGAGIGKRMLAANVAVYQKLGIDVVEVHANIDVGGYAWARYGYVPTQRSWDSLRRSLSKQVNALGGGGGDGGGVTPSSWDEMTSSQHEDIERAWMRATASEFHASEVESWRDSGGPLNEAKDELADSYSASDEWAQAGLTTWREQRVESGKPDAPFTDAQLLNAISVDYDDSDGDGRNDPEISFDDDKLRAPKGYDPAQQTLPGIKPVEPHEMLTDDMRKGIEKELIKAFNSTAENNAADIEPPSHLSSNVSEFQADYWSQMGDDDKYRWAARNDELPEIESEDEPVEIEDADAKEVLRKALNSSDPKALWVIADSVYGKDLLLHSDWNGELDLNDKETMARFNAYVGRK